MALVPATSRTTDTFTGAAAGGDLSGTYPSPQLGAGVILNADVNAGAAIAYSKLSLAGSVVNADIAAGAAIAASKLSGFPNDATKVLAGDGTWPAAAAAGPTLVRKTADQAVINSNTFTSDTALTFVPAANTKYWFKIFVIADTTAAADFQYQMVGPAAPTLFRAVSSRCAAAAVPSWQAVATALIGSQGLAATSGNGVFVYIEGVLHNAADTTALAFQFSQQTAVNDTGAIVRAGSYIEYAVVA